MERTAKILVAGQRTAIGATLFERLVKSGHRAALKEPKSGLGRFIRKSRPDYIIVTAGMSGGIEFNQKHGSELMLDNLNVTLDALNAALDAKPKKLLYVAPACVYPKLSAQPMKPESLLTGPLEPTNEGYALAKLAGLKLCQAIYREKRGKFITAIHANDFGPRDDFSSEQSHVIPALIKKFEAAKKSSAKSVDIWGSGNAVREFVYLDDLADAALFVLDHYDREGTINIGGGEAFSIKELALMVRDVTGYRGDIKFDASKPDGMPLKQLDSSPLLKMGWKPKHVFKDALRDTYHSFLKSKK